MLSVTVLMDTCSDTLKQRDICTIYVSICKERSYINGVYRVVNRSRKVCMAHPELFNYSIDVFHDHALRWLDGASRHADPFFLYYSFTIPHAGGWLDE